MFYCLAFLFFLASLIYIPSLSGDFVLDDWNLVAAYSTHASAGSWLGAFASKWMFVNYRPVTALSFMLNGAFGGVNPFWYHVPSVLLHACITCLIFAAAVRLRLGRRAAFIAALLFCLHPVQVESVAFIGARPGGLSLMFCLVAFILYVPLSEAGPRRRMGWRLGAFLTSWALALLAKESAASLLLVLGAYDWTSGAARRDVRSFIGRWALSGAVVFAYLCLRRLVVGRWAQRGPWGGDWFTHAELALHGLFRDVQLVFWPAHLKDCYSFYRPGPWFGLESLLIAVAIVTLGAYVLARARMREIDAVAWAWVFAGLLPVANILPLAAFAADRFLYMPMVGFSILSGRWLGRLKSPLLAVALAGLYGLMGLKTVDRELAWRSQFALDLDAYAADPGDPCSCLRLGKDYFDWGMLDTAQAYVRRALANGPSVLDQTAVRSLASIEAARRRFRSLPGY